MISTAAAARVLYLRSGTQVATGFLSDFEGKQYLVTAKHFAKVVSVQHPLEVLRGGAWEDAQATLIGHGHDEIDISVFAVGKFRVLSDCNLSLDASVFYSQDVYFMGYPIGRFGDLRNRAVEIGHLPFVRRAIVSCLEDTDAGAHRTYLAGHNVPGFSGGPVLWARDANRTPPSDYRVLAVVSGYEGYLNKLHVNGQLTDAAVTENSGIVLSYSTKHALELIQENPNGMPLR